MIETREAMAELEAILSVPELDGIYVGPSDLAASLGHPPVLDPETPEVVDAIATILKAAKKHGKRTGIHTLQPAYARRMLDQGFDFTSIASDARLMGARAQEAVAAARGTAAAPQAKTY